MIRIPLTQPVRGGQIGVKISPDLGTQSLKALSQLAGTVGQVGQKIQATNEKLARVENERLVNNYQAQIKRATAEYSNELLTNKNPQEWRSGYNQRIGSVISGLDIQKLSPEAQQAFNAWSEDYRSSQELKIDRDSILAGVKNATLDLNNNLREYEERGDFESSRARVRDSVLFSDAEKKRSLLDIDDREDRWLKQQEAKQRGELNKAVELDIIKDPFGARDRLDHNILWTHLDDYGREVYKRKADAAIVSAQKDIYNQGLDRIESGELLSEQDINTIGQRLTPRGLARLHDFAEESRNDDLKEEINSPEYQSELASSLTSLILDIDPKNIKGSDQELELLKGIRQVRDPDIKNRLQESYKAVLGESQEESATRYTQGLKILKDHFKGISSSASQYEPEVVKRSTLSHLDDGFFDDTEKLKALGASDDQIKWIRAATEEFDGIKGKDKQTTVKAQAKRFQQIYRNFEGEATADDETLRLAEAVGNGKFNTTFSEYEVVDEDAKLASLKELNNTRLAQAKKIEEYTKWHSQNPEAGYDEHVKQINMLGVQATEDSLRQHRLPTRDQSVGRSFKTSLKLSNYGYSSDTTPDSYSKKSIGHASNRLRDEQSAAITKSLAVKLGLKRGAVIEIQTTKGSRLVTYDDTVPSTDKRTGPLPETIDIFRKGKGSNKWGGKVTGVKMILQGRDGISGRKYSDFSASNYKKALSIVR